MKYKITTKKVVCKFLEDIEGNRPDCRDANIYNCLRCENNGKEEEITKIYTKEEYVDLIKKANVYITGIELYEN